MIRVDPTATGDMRASLTRRWYEANRECWWNRLWPIAYADEWMISFRNEVARINELSDIKLWKEYHS